MMTSLDLHLNGDTRQRIEFFKSNKVLLLFGDRWGETSERVIIGVTDTLRTQTKCHLPRRYYISMHL
jgi:hypothetical protein